MADSRQLKVDVVDLTCPAGSDPSVGDDGDEPVFKFVLISCDAQFNFVLGRVSQFPYHANLVDRFCDRQGIAAGWVRKPDLVEIYDTEYAVRGGGWMKLDRSGNSLEVYGNSSAYGKYDPSDLSLVVRVHPFFAGYTVSVSR
ncbi:MAG: hypothetical protein KAU35_10710 [candidate division Zixibacteria bacterium]|nr:hypothetical protein [candidate division Zixibacteria bacterium]